jgi:NDP-sugar pyrophosphorylase family protein
MQAIILAIDEERKLPPLTDTVPGPLIPVLDRPAMVMTVEILARAGFKRILVSLSNHDAPIRASISSYIGVGIENRWGVNLVFDIQRESVGSAGSLKQAPSHMLGETFIVLPGDALIDLDIQAALAFHQAHGGSATAILHTAVRGSSAPILHLDANSQVAAEGMDLSATGAFIFEPSVLNHIPSHSHFDILSQLIPAMLAAGEPVHGYQMAGYWSPLDSLASFQEAQQVMLYSAFKERVPEKASEGPAATVRYPSLSSRQIAPGVWVGLHDSIHPTVKIAAPVYIGENSYIGREVELGTGTVICSNVVIDDEATIRRSTILSETYVGQLLNIVDRIVSPTSISDPESGETTAVVDPFLLSRVGAQSDEPSQLVRVLSGMVAIFLLVIASPLLLLLWLLAMIGSGGQPLTRSPRLGHRIIQDGSLYRFNLLSFQTRRQNGGYILGGRWMERWELNRLPELFNVLRGDLALVGVKPLRPEDVAYLSEDWHQKRHDFPAGLTGLWYQQTEPNSDLDTVIIADIYYVATRTWRSDLLLFLRTPAIWARRNARRSPAHETLVHADNVESM